MHGSDRPPYTWLMLSVEEQVRSGRLVCPVTRQRLRYDGTRLSTEDSTRTYPIHLGIPVLMPDPVRYAEFLGRDDSTVGPDAIQARWLQGPKRVVHGLIALGGDHRAEQSRQAFEQLLAEQPDSALCLSVGGGPSRPHPNLINLNIGPFQGVDVVGEANHLPYADGSVDAVYCEAVLEHLELPQQAVAEMYRVMKPGGQALAVTPFLQAYHGHPNHYQNFTLTGHRRLFERADFDVLSAGVCVGPTTALSELMCLYAREYVPTRLLGRAAWILARLGSIPAKFLDRLLNRSERAHVLASTTYVHAIKRRERVRGNP